MATTGQLNLFEQANPSSSVVEPEPPTLDDYTASHFELENGLALGGHVQIINAGPPLQHLNGLKGKVVGLFSATVSVQVEGIAVALTFRPEALQKWTPISEYMSASDEAESVEWFRVGDLVECHTAFLGKVGTVQRISIHCAATVAWVDYGKGKPLYPCPLEHLTLAE